MESLSLAPPHTFHHKRHGKSPRRFHKHVRTVTDKGGHMYGHGRKYGHGHGRRGHRMRREIGEGEAFLFDGEQWEREWKGQRGRDGCHGCDKRHGGRHGRWGRGGSPVLKVSEETGQNEDLTNVKEAASGKESLTAVKVAEDATEPASAVETDWRHGCHSGRSRHGRHGFHGRKDKHFLGRDGSHGKYKFGKEHKRNKSHKRDRRNAPLDVIMSTDAFTLLMDAPGVTIDDVSVTSEDAVLKISTERKLPREDETEGERVLVRERMFGSHVRQVALPKDAVLEAATSEITEGVLTVSVPRRRQDAEGENRTVHTEGIHTKRPRGESVVDAEMADVGAAAEIV